MGALPPIAPWLPKDDLLLRNAVEAGASLESLAKGAVRFSRRFTIQELQDRWQSLLYDSDAAVQASAHMVELELSASVSLSSQSNRSGDSKGTGIPAKRKEESVRSHYYAMRKRICNEPFNNMDLSFLAAPNLHNCAGNGGCEEQLTIHNEHPVGNCMLRDPDPFVLHDTNFDIVHHDFESNMRVDTSADGTAGVRHAFHSGRHDTFEGHIQGEMIDGNCLYGYVENVTPVPTNEAVGNDMGHSFHHVLGEHVFDDNVFQTSDSKAEPLSAFDPPDNPGTVCSAYDGNQGFTSSASFHDLGYSSPGPTLPNWLEDLTVPAIPTDENFAGKCQGRMVLTDDDGKNMSSSEFNILDAEPHLEGVSGGGRSPILEGDFVNISSSFLTFTNNFLLDDDRSCLEGVKSLLLGSPSGSHQDDISGDADINALSSTLSTLTWDPHPERRNGVICCTLNTEDPEVPDNDDVPSPTQMHSPFRSAGLQHRSEGPSSSASPSTKDFAFNQQPDEQGLDHANREEFLVNSWPTESQVLPEHLNNPIKASGLKTELPLSNSLPVMARHTVPAGELSQCASAPLTPYPMPGGELKDETAKAEVLNSFDNFLLEKSQNFFDGVKEQGDVPTAIQNPMSTNLDQISIGIPLTDPVINPSTSDQEDQHSEKDDDIPSFSDVEAMILEMDLVPSDQESCFRREVSRYQYEETKRAIVRLEQGAHSCMQRAIRSNKAFAVLYGRHLKYYIEKPEVTLGRATDDFEVDVDLAKEGPANKISRRQALIKMEEDGTFSLKNLGKGSILVNSKEVASGHYIKLGSGCLIEIRSMRFMFEMHQTAVRRFLSTKSKKNQGTKFEWSPEGVH